MQGRDRGADVGSTHMDTEGEGGGRTNGESSTDMYTLPSVKQAASGKPLCNTGSSAWRCDDLEGMWRWEARGERDELCTELIHTEAQRKLAPHCKVTLLCRKRKK